MRNENNMTPKLITFTLIITILLSIIPKSTLLAQMEELQPFTFEANNTQSSNNEVNLLSETISATIPSLVDTTYSITQPSELVWLSEKVAVGESFSGYTIELKNDIDFNGATWDSIGYNLNNYFAGTFNGNNYSIKNFVASGSVDSFTIINSPRHTVGFFGVCSNAIIQDVVFEDITFKIKNESGYSNSYSSINGTSVYGGIVCGYAVNSEFQNITVRNSSVEVYTGSEAGYAYAGGIVGYANNCNFEYCGNESGTVKATTDSLNNNASAGGIIGELANEGTVRQCYNTSAIYGGASTCTAYTGGIVGKSSNNSNTLSTIRDCYNQGALYHTGSYLENGYMGGIIGYSASTVNQCYNSGTITANTSSFGTVCLAGISGSGISSSSVSNSAVMTKQISGGTSQYIVAGTGTKENNIAYNGLSVTNDTVSRYALSDFYGSTLYTNTLLWDFTNIWESVTDGFPILRSKEEEIDSTIQIVYDAASALHIQFAEGDTYNRVTQNITLPSSPNEAEVVWSSSNEEVISASTGIVQRQDEEYRVKVIATISYETYSVEKKFVLNVIGTSENTEVESPDWGMSLENARSLIAMIRGCKYEDVDIKDKDVLVLTGADLTEENAINTWTSVLEFMEVPGENAFLKTKLGNVVDILKEGEDAILTDLLGKVSNGGVKWDKDEETGKVNFVTIAQNLANIPEAVYNVKGKFIKGFDTFMGLSKFSFKDTLMETTFDYCGKIGKIIDYVYERGSQGSGKGHCSEIISITSRLSEIFALYDAYEVAKSNAVQAYLKMYMENRPYFDSPDDEMFQLMMSANIVTSIKTDIENLDEVAEQLYRLKQKFGNGLSEEYKITIKCPVDVIVYDSTGKIVGRVIDNVVDETINNSLLITVGGENSDEKTVYIQDDEVYTIDLIGNDSGTMNVEIENQTQSSTAVYCYNDIALADGKAMNLEVSSASFEDDSELPFIYCMEEGVETDDTESIDTSETEYLLTIHSCISNTKNGLVLSNQGGYYETGYVTSGTDLESLVTVNEGYSLDGFYTDADCTTAFVDKKMPESELVLYAKFIENDTILTEPGSSTITGEGTILDYDKGPIYNVTLPTENALGFTIDPHNLSSLSTGESMVIDTSTGVGPVFSNPGCVAMMVNRSSVPIKVTVGFSIYDESDVPINLVTSKDEVAIGKEKNMFFTVVPSAQKTILAEDYRPAGMVIPVINDSSQEIEFELEESVYRVVNRNDAFQLELAEDIPNNCDGTGFQFSGFVNKAADWSEYVGISGKKLAIGVVFRFEEYDGNGENVEGVYGLLEGNADLENSE